MAPGHGAINGYKRMVLDHYKSPNCDGKRQPNRNIVDDNAEVIVEPHVSGPATRVLLGDVFRGKQLLMKEEWQVFDD